MRHEGSAFRIDTAKSPGASRHRPTVAELDLDALERNVAEVRRLAGPARVMAIVKANAYGHGTVLVARALQQLGVDAFGVALVEEGVELREAGISGQILVLDGAYADYDALLAYELVPVVYAVEHLQRLQEAAQRAGRKVKAHVKLDTGMGRVGVPPHELEAFIAAARLAPQVVLEGALSHFSHADLADEAVSRAQIGRFREAVAALRAAGHPVALRHLANSSAVIGVDEVKDGFELNLVRPGLMLYGEYPAERFRAVCNLSPVLTWKTAIVQLKRVAKGTPVSYGGTWTAPRESVIATLPVGYADGYNRRLSNNGEVLVHGARAPIVGRVCMDLCMADVTDIPGVAVHDEVVLLGRQGDDAITATELAGRCQTIHYEILCAVGARVPRTAVRGGR